MSTHTSFSTTYLLWCLIFPHNFETDILTQMLFLSFQWISAFQYSAHNVFHIGQTSPLFLLPIHPWCSISFLLISFISLMAAYKSEYINLLLLFIALKKSVKSSSMKVVPITTLADLSFGEDSITGWNIRNYLAYSWSQAKYNFFLQMKNQIFQLRNPSQGYSDKCILSQFR